MSLIAKISILRSDIEKLQKLGVSDEKAIHYKKRADELTQVSKDLTNINLYFNVLTEHKIPTSINENKITTIKNKLISVKESFLQEPESILKSSSGEDLRFTLIKPLSDLPNDLQPNFQFSWRLWCESQMPKISSEVLLVLENVGSIRAKIQDLKSIKLSLERFSLSIPTNNLQVENFISKIGEFSKQWESLGGNDIPPEVISFIREAGQSTGVKLDLLSKPISEWLESHNLKQSLRIRII